MATPVLMFMNMKGGVGKTTLAVEVSRTLAYEYDKDVLLIDYDPQANASFAFLDPRRYFGTLESGKGIARCLMPVHDEKDPFSVVQAASSENVDAQTFSVRVRNWYYPDNPSKKAGSLHLLPGDLELMRLALNVLSGETETKLLSRWNALLLSARKSFDCIVLDCHPAGSFFTKSALLGSDAVVVPVTSDAYAATGLGMMRQHMEMWESSGGAKDFLVLFNDAHHSWDDSVESQIRRDNRFATHCLTNRVPYTTLLRNLARRHQTAAEQPVPYKKKVGRNISAVSEEMVRKLQERSIFDSTWG